jgi:hypothetical protein
MNLINGLLKTLIMTDGMELKAHLKLLVLSRNSLMPGKFLSWPKINFQGIIGTKEITKM